MAIKSIQLGQPGVSNITPSWVYIATNDTYATVTTAGYLNGAAREYVNSFQNNMMALVSTQTSQSIGVAPVLYLLQVQVSNGVWSLVAPAVDVPIPFIVPGVIEALDTTASATPGTIRAMIGSMTDTATTMTSGNLVGVRGVVNAVGATGGFLYGIQGKIIPTGTLSGSLWAAAVFGQFDLSHPAVINGAQLAALWGDWGATGGTATDLSGCRGIAFTNTTANVLNAQDYRYGNATYLLELAGAGGTLNYYANAGTSAGSAGDAAHCAAQKVIKIEINGVAAYIPVFTQNT